MAVDAGPGLSAPRVQGLGLLAFAVLCVSTGAIFARLAEAPALVIALWRCGLATLFLALLARLRGARPRSSALPWRASVGTPLLCGALLAAHFALWIRSLELTSVAASVFLVATTPLWVALAAPRVTGEAPGKRGWIGLALGLTGSLVIALGPSEGEPLGWHGPALAVGGAVAMAAYALVARRERAALPLASFLVRVYASATVLLALFVLASGTDPLPKDWETAGWLVALALVPQLLGHSGVNAALRVLPADLVTLALLGEPVLGTVMAWRFLGEAPGPNVFLGGGLVAVGVAVAARRPRSTPLFRPVPGRAALWQMRPRK